MRKSVFPSIPYHNQLATQRQPCRSGAGRQPHASAQRDPLPLCSAQPRLSCELQARWHALLVGRVRRPALGSAQHAPLHQPRHFHHDLRPAGRVAPSAHADAAQPDWAWQQQAHAPLRQGAGSLTWQAPRCAPARHATACAGLPREGGSALTGSFLAQRVAGFALMLAHQGPVPCDTHSVLDSGASRRRQSSCTCLSSLPKRRAPGW